MRDSIKFRGYVAVIVGTGSGIFNGRGRARAADLVLPTSQSPSALLPELLTLLDVRDAPTRYGLFTTAGRRLQEAVPLAEQKLNDGQQLSLLPIADAPAEPLVHDVVDRLVHHRGSGLWNAETSPWVYGALTAMLMLAGVFLLPGARMVPWVPFGGFVLLAMATTAFEARALAWSFFTAASVVAIVAPSHSLIAHPTMTWWIPVVAVLVITVGVLRDRLRAALTGVAVFAVLLGVAWLSTLLGARTEEAAAITGIAALAAIGVLPRIALAGAGLYAIADGEEYRVTQVDHAVVDAYGGLTAATTLVSLVLGACLVLIGPHALSSEFAALTFATLGIAALVRTRHFPMALHRLVLSTAVLAGAISLGFAIATAGHGAAMWVGVVAIAVGLALVAAPLAARMSPVNKAHGRRIAGVVEKISVLASIPAVVGMFGVFRDLLRTFQ